MEAEYIAYFEVAKNCPFIIQFLNKLNIPIKINVYIHNKAEANFTKICIVDRWTQYLQYEYTYMYKLLVKESNN